MNCRHGDFQSPALPTELPRREVVLFVTTKMLVQISPRLGKHFFSFFAENLNFFCPASILFLSGQAVSLYFQAVAGTSSFCAPCPRPFIPQDPHGLPPLSASLHPGIRCPAQPGRLDAHGPGPAHGPRLRRGHRPVPLALYHHQWRRPRPCGRTGSLRTTLAGPDGRRAAAHGPDGRAAPALRAPHRRQRHPAGGAHRSRKAAAHALGTGALVQVRGHPGRAQCRSFRRTRGPLHHDGRHRRRGRGLYVARPLPRQPSPLSGGRRRGWHDRRLRRARGRHVLRLRGDEDPAHPAHAALHRPFGPVGLVHGGRSAGLRPGLPLRPAARPALEPVLAAPAGAAWPAACWGPCTMRA